MINAILYWLSGRLPVRLIDINGRPYLERYYLGTVFGVTFLLHRFVSSDRERHVHNHPWAWGRSIVLTGLYDEELVTDIAPLASRAGVLSIIRRVRWYNRINGNTFHRIAAAKPGTWTLVMHGPRETITTTHGEVRFKGWGFLDRIDVGEPDELQYATIFSPVAATSADWWTTAPKGRDSDRLPERV